MPLYWCKIELESLVKATNENEAKELLMWRYGLHGRQLKWKLHDLITCEKID